MPSKLNKSSLSNVKSLSIEIEKKDQHMRLDDSPKLTGQNLKKSVQKKESMYLDIAQLSHGRDLEKTDLAVNVSVSVKNRASIKNNTSNFFSPKAHSRNQAIMPFSMVGWNRTSDDIMQSNDKKTKQNFMKIDESPHKKIDGSSPQDSILKRKAQIKSKLREMDLTSPNGFNLPGIYS